MRALLVDVLCTAEASIIVVSSDTHHGDTNNGRTSTRKEGRCHTAVESGFKSTIRLSMMGFRGFKYGSSTAGIVYLNLVLWGSIITMILALILLGTGTKDSVILPCSILLAIAVSTGQPIATLPSTDS